MRMPPPKGRGENPSLQGRSRERFPCCGNVRKSSKGGSQNYIVNESKRLPLPAGRGREALSAYGRKDPTRKMLPKGGGEGRPVDIKTKSRQGENEPGHQIRKKKENRLGEISFMLPAKKGNGIFWRREKKNGAQSSSPQGRESERSYQQDKEGFCYGSAWGKKGKKNTAPARWENIRASSLETLRKWCRRRRQETMTGELGRPPTIIKNIDQREFFHD